jgi:hypothetical protein
MIIRVSRASSTPLQRTTARVLARYGSQDLARRILPAAQAARYDLASWLQRRKRRRQVMTAACVLVACVLVTADGIAGQLIAGHPGVRLPGAATPPHRLAGGPGSRRCQALTPRGHPVAATVRALPGDDCRRGAAAVHVEHASGRARAGTRCSRAARDARSTRENRGPGLTQLPLQHGDPVTLRDQSCSTPHDQYPPFWTESRLSADCFV